MFKKTLFSICLAASIFTPFVVAGVASAQTAVPGVDPLGINYGGAIGLSKTDPRLLVGQIVKIGLGLLGTIALVIMIYAGFEWMTSAGNDEKTGAAKNRMIAATIGLIIILAAYGLSSFVIKQLYLATQGTAYTE